MLRQTVRSILTSSQRHIPCPSLLIQPSRTNLVRSGLLRFPEARSGLIVASVARFHSTPRNQNLHLLVASILKVRHSKLAYATFAKTRLGINGTRAD